MSGKLIVFEGIEGSGKTTQMQRVRNWLMHEKLGREVPILMTREPGGTALGGELRRLLLGNEGASVSDRAELLLFAADRAQHVEEILKPQLARGAIILCDRFTDSTIAYQGYGRRMNLQLIEQLNQIATGGLTSDLTIWLDVEVERAQARVQKRGQLDRIEQTNLAFYQRVRQGYTSLAATHQQRIVRVDANGSETEVQQQIQTLLSQKFQLWESIQA